MTLKYPIAPLRHLARHALLCIGMVMALACPAQHTGAPAGMATDSAGATATDTLEASLLTCSPGHEVHRLYGHTALRLASPNEDWAVNFGWFSFNTPNFIAKFILGLTDYSAAWQTTGIFLYDYYREGMGVTAQRLNLTPAEAIKLRDALRKVLETDGYRTYDIPVQSKTGPNHDEKVLGANWTYRYNFLYDNCTTRAVDAIRWALQSEGEDLVFPDLRAHSPRLTQREMIHEFTTGSPWYELGQDLMLGPEVDEGHNLYAMAKAWTDWVDGKKHQATDDAPNFLPTYAQRIFAEAYIRDAKGNLRPLVKATDDLTPFLQRTPNQPAIPLTPTAAATILLALTALASFGEWKSRRQTANANLQRAWRIWGNALDTMLWTLLGSVGIVLTILTGWSAHPAVDANWLTFLFSPAFLLAIVLRFTSHAGDKVAAFTALAAAAFTVVCHFSGMQWIPTAVLLLALAICLRAAMALARNVQNSHPKPLQKAWGAWTFVVAYALLQLVSLRVI